MGVLLIPLGLIGFIVGIVGLILPIRRLGITTDRAQPRLSAGDSP